MLFVVTERTTRQFINFKNKLRHLFDFGDINFKRMYMTNYVVIHDGKINRSAVHGRTEAREGFVFQTY